MPDAHETHAQTHAEQEEPGPPCQCEQQFGNALPLLIVALTVVMALDRWNSWRKKRSQARTDDIVEPKRPIEGPEASKEEYHGNAR